MLFVFPITRFESADAFDLVRKHGKSKVAWNQHVPKDVQNFKLWIG